MIERYNAYMGGVEKSDQFLAYHNVLRKTVRYWKTLFYHMIDTAAVNAFILYNPIATSSGIKTITENEFRDHLVLQIIDSYGKEKREEKTAGQPSRSDCRVKHGSRLFPHEGRARCQLCWMHRKVTNWTQRKCPDCLFTPALCQTVERDSKVRGTKQSLTEPEKLGFTVARKKGNSFQQQKGLAHLVPTLGCMLIQQKVKYQRGVVSEKDEETIDQNYKL